MTRRLGRVDTKIWCADDLGAAELLRGRFADYSYDIHTHDRACFALITSGAIRIRTRGTEVVARPGDLYAIDADEPHAGWPVDDRGWSLRTLHVDVSRLQALVGDDDNGPAPIPAIAGPIIRDPDLASMFHGVHCCSEVAGTPLEREERYLDFITRLFTRHTRGALAPRPHGPELHAIRLAQDFLDHNLDQRVRLADIAEAVGLSPFRLFRAFRRTTGMSPHDYQRQARLRLATGLIRLGCPLGEVAATAGFADQAHLTRSFRSTMGSRPARTGMPTSPRVDQVPDLVPQALYRVVARKNFSRLNPYSLTLNPMPKVRFKPGIKAWWARPRTIPADHPHRWSSQLETSPRYPRNWTRAFSIRFGEGCAHRTPHFSSRFGGCIGPLPVWHQWALLARDREKIRSRPPRPRPTGPQRLGRLRVLAETS